MTDDEGTFLPLLPRVRRTAAYQLSKIYTESRVSNFGTSKGKVYPLIRRLNARRLLAAKSVSGDGRGTEELECTAAGTKAARQWVKQIWPTYFLPEDPLRIKVQSFDLLSRDRQIEWIVEAKSGLAGKARGIWPVGRRALQGAGPRQCGKLDPQPDELARPAAAQHRRGRARLRLRPAGSPAPAQKSSRTPE